jgi:hypothetical protein
MRKMKNITVSIPENAYLRARVWSAEHECSLSCIVAYLLETLPRIRDAPTPNTLCAPKRHQPAAANHSQPPAHGYPVPQSRVP